MQYLELQEKKREAGEEELLRSLESRMGMEGEQEPEPEGEEETALRKLLESQRMIEELCGELEKMKNNYDVATGTRGETVN